MRFKRILIGFIFYSGCHPNEQTTQPLASTTTDSTHEVSVEQKHEKPVLKDMEINEKEIFRKMASSPELNDDEKKRLAIAVIDSMVIGTYHILDTVFHNSNSMILLLARKYAEENMAWLANYTKGKLQSFKKVYYDNAEGFFQISSSVKNNRITISTNNEMAEENSQTKEIFTVNEQLRFVAIQ